MRSYGNRYALTNMHICTLLLEKHIHSSGRFLLMSCMQRPGELQCCRSSRMGPVHFNSVCILGMNIILIGIARVTKYKWNTSEKMNGSLSLFLSSVSVINPMLLSVFYSPSFSVSVYLYLCAFSFSAITLYVSNCINPSLFSSFTHIRPSVSFLYFPSLLSLHLALL